MCHPHHKFEENIVSLLKIFFRLAFMQIFPTFAQPFWLARPVGPVGAFPGSVTPPGNSREWAEIPPFEFFGESEMLRSHFPKFDLKGFMPRNIFAKCSLLCISVLQCAPVHTRQPDERTKKKRDSKSNA